MWFALGWLAGFSAITALLGVVSIGLAIAFALFVITIVFIGFCTDFSSGRRSSSDSSSSGSSDSSGGAFTAGVIVGSSIDSGSSDCGSGSSDSSGGSD